MITTGSKVKVKGTNNTGIIVEFKDNFAKVAIENQYVWHPLSDLEEDLTLIDKLLKNELDNGLDFILSMDAYRLLTEYRFNPYVLASSTKIHIYPHQIDEVFKILDNPRMMIADEVGLGKTIVAALLASELKARGLADKQLFIVPKSLVIKWKDELNDRFDMGAVIIDSDYVRVNGNPFRHKEYVYIASMDYLKQEHVMKLMDCDFDLIVIDEAHKLAIGTDRLALGKYIAQRSNFLLFLTATPHNGDNEDFLTRMKLLDPYVYDVASTGYLLVRNLKEDAIELDGKEVFPPRESKTVEVELSLKEAKINDMIDAYISRRLEEARTREEQNAIRFVTTIIRKRASSSFYALKKTLGRRLKKLGAYEDVKSIMREMKKSEEDFEEEAYDENENKIIGYTLAKIAEERDELASLIKAVEGLEETDSKLQMLLEFIRKVKESDRQAKIIVFSEYRDTINYLKEKLSKSYKIEHIDGTMSVEERNNALGKFRDPNGAEIMVCTDAAGEGIDMQFCNIEINYDLPWNPNKLEQRMGRIHRIGQRRKVYYYNFIIKNTIDGYILGKLFDKIESIKEAIGDKIYDVIGKLVSETEIATLYEELLRIPKDQWEAKVKKIEGIVEEKRRILNEIDKLLSGHRLDRSKLEDMKRRIRDAVDKDEVKRFVEIYVNSKGGKIETIGREEEICRIFLPKHLAFSTDKGIIEGSFRNDIAIEKNYPYLALGNKTIINIVNDVAKPSVAVLKHPTLNGLLFVYKVLIKDGKGRDRNGKTIGLLYSDGKIVEIDLRSVWDLELFETEPFYETSLIVDAKGKADEFANNFATNLLTDTSRRLAVVEDKTREAIMKYYSNQMEQIDTKIKELNQKLTESPHFARLIQRENTRKVKVQQELDKKLEEIKRDFVTIPIIELVGIAVIIAGKDADIKKLVELEGMKAVLEHERKRAMGEEQRAKIRDVSEKFKGYDIESFDRVIEVKSFRESGPIEMTTHEWLIASRLRKEYWLYAVENALHDPQITPIQDPFDTFKDEVKKIPVIEYKYVIDGWKLKTHPTN